jgi:hypothetical protein
LRDHLVADLQNIVDRLKGIKPQLPSALQILDVEMTQSTQFFNFDGRSSGAASDNSVSLIANKMTVLRVYVAHRTGPTGYVPARFTGEVRVAGQVLQPLNGIRPLQERAALRRAYIDDSLNFRIPANLCVGLRQFEVRIWDPDRELFQFNVPLGAGGRSSDSGTYGARFWPQPPMKLQGVLITYAGPQGNTSAPVGMALVDTVVRFLPMFPIHGFDFGPCTSLTVTDDLSIQPGNKGSAWDSTLNTLANLRTASTLRTYFVGLLPKGLPTSLGSNNVGIGRPGCAIAPQDYTRALSHELGHACWLAHLKDGFAPAPWDTNYPQYGSFPSTSIGEFGLDTARLTLFDPNSDRDLMGYYDPPDVPYPAYTWISPYNYRNMMNNIRDSDGTGDLILVGKLLDTASPMMMLNFRLHRGGRIELRPSWPVTRVLPLSAPLLEPATHIDLLGHGQEILASVRCHEHNDYQDPAGAFLDFHELLSWPEGVTGIAVVRDGRTIDAVKIDGPAPKVSLKEMRRIESKGVDLAHLHWTVDSGGDPHAALVRYTPDGGRTYYAVAAGIIDTSHLIDLASLPGGDQCRLEVTVSVGLQSATVLTDDFAVMPRPRRARIVSPRDGEIVAVGQPVGLLGAGHSPDSGVCAPDEIVWHSHLQGLLGTGCHVIREDLVAGLHRITMSLPDGHTGMACASVWVRVGENNGQMSRC